MSIKSFARMYISDKLPLALAYFRRVNTFFSLKIYLLRGYPPPHHRIFPNQNLCCRFFLWSCKKLAMNALLCLLLFLQNTLRINHKIIFFVFLFVWFVCGNCIMLSKQWKLITSSICCTDFRNWKLGAWPQHNYS